MMIEKIMVRYLNDVGITAFMEVPEDPPNEFVIVEKTGSRRSSMLESSTVAVQSYAGTLTKAAEINDQAKTVILDMDSLYEISSVELQSDYFFPDEQTKKYRYQAVFDIAHY